MRPSWRRSYRLLSTSSRKRRVPALTASHLNSISVLVPHRHAVFCLHTVHRHTEFPTSKNTSVTAMLYKNGDMDDLKNYQPFSLLNVDILTKAPTNRLVQVLPSAVHHTQTLVDGSRIDHTIHMLRGLIQLANDQDMETESTTTSFSKLCRPSVSGRIHSLGSAPLLECLHPS